MRSEYEERGAEGEGGEESRYYIVVRCGRAGLGGWTEEKGTGRGLADLVLLVRYSTRSSTCNGDEY